MSQDARYQARLQRERDEQIARRLDRLKAERNEAAEALRTVYEAVCPDPAPNATTTQRMDAILERWAAGVRSEDATDDQE